MAKLLFEEETFAIRGAVFEVYRELGCGFLEAVYEECLRLELQERGIPFVAQKELPVFYKGKPIKQVYRADIVCHDAIILELKATRTILPEHQAQLLHYLKATGCRVGLLVNFGSHPKATIERLIL